MSEFVHGGEGEEVWLRKYMIGSGQVLVFLWEGIHSSRWFVLNRTEDVGMTHASYICPHYMPLLHVKSSFTFPKSLLSPT